VPADRDDGYPIQLSKDGGADVLITRGRHIDGVAIPGLESFPRAQSFLDWARELVRRAKLARGASSQTISELDRVIGTRGFGPRLPLHLLN
jgi:hypothetical protein